MVIQLFVGSKSKKMAVKMTAIAMYNSCSVKIPCGLSFDFSGSEKMFDAKCVCARFPTLVQSAQASPKYSRPSILPCNVDLVDARNLARVVADEFHSLGLVE